MNDDTILLVAQRALDQLLCEYETTADLLEAQKRAEAAYKHYAELRDRAEERARHVADLRRFIAMRQLEQQ